jgi:site-specific DNA-adenine methylase
LKKVQKRKDELENECKELKNENRELKEEMEERENVYCNQQAQQVQFLILFCVWLYVG